MTKRRISRSLRKPSTAERLLPPALWQLSLTQLRVDEQIAERLAKRGLVSVADLFGLATNSFGPRGKLPPADYYAVRAALTRALDDGLRQFAGAEGDDEASVCAHLLGPLEDQGRALFAAAVGIDREVASRQQLQQMLSQGASLDESLDRIRATLLQNCTGLLSRLRNEIEAELRAFDGALHSQHAASGSLVRMLAETGEDSQFGLRLAAFCLPHQCYLHRAVLHGVSPRRFRELLRALPQLVPQHRLPLPIDKIVEQLASTGIEVPRGVLLHVLRTELRTAIELDSVYGEIAVPDPLTPAARLVEILTEFDKPTLLADLVFAYRELYRFASQSRLLRHLAKEKAFLQIAPDTWTLRQWHEQELADTAPLVEKIVRWICNEGGRHRVGDLISDQDGDERTPWLVLDCLADDPRVRLLGRGEACPADQQQSAVMEKLQLAFRQAAGDIVASRFIENHPPAQQRLVRRLLEHNRAFVRSGDNRIDMLCNYPFNAERMQRLISLVRAHLQQRTGYAQAEALADAVNKTDLGGSWLTAELLADILRRNGPFVVLAPGIVALANLSLPARLMRTTRQALREAGEAVTIADVVRARPDLAEFSECLADLLCQDQLVQTPDGKYFILA